MSKVQGEPYDPSKKDTQTEPVAKQEPVESKSNNQQCDPGWVDKDGFWQAKPDDKSLYSVTQAVQDLATSWAGFFLINHKGGEYRDRFNSISPGFGNAQRFSNYGFHVGNERSYDVEIGSIRTSLGYIMTMDTKKADPNPAPELALLGFVDPTTDPSTFSVADIDAFIQILVGAGLVINQGFAATDICKLSPAKIMDAIKAF